MKVILGNKTIFTASPNHYRILTFRKNVQLTGHSNLLKFIGYGNNNSYGMTVSNISLKLKKLWVPPCHHPHPHPQPHPHPCPYSKEYIVNGNFITN